MFMHRILLEDDIEPTRTKKEIESAYDEIGKERS